MIRSVEIGPATLLLGDCREILPALGRFDAVVSDPPYGINTVYGRKKTVTGRCSNLATRNKHADTPIFGDDSPFDPHPCLAACANVLLWGANHYHASLPETGRWLAWNKLGGLPPWDTFSDVEFAWHSLRGASRIFSYLWKGITRQRLVGDSTARSHPNQKPIALMRWCLDQIGPAETVLDPYMGAGTTGVACIQDGRLFIGIEIEERWFDVAVQRITEAVKKRP